MQFQFVTHLMLHTPNGYTFSGEAGALPTLTFARQGEYTFDVNNLGHPFGFKVYLEHQVYFRNNQIKVQDKY
jgi:hypothetical protein